MRIAVDARSAAETLAGRGRYVRELLSGFARLDIDHEFILYAREAWQAAGLDGRFRWRTFKAPSLAWPLLAGRRMSRAADVGLACTSYAITAPWRIPGAALVWDFVPFERSLHPPRGSGLERATLRIALRRCGALIAISATTRDELTRRYPSARAKALVAPPAAGNIFSPRPREDDEQTLAGLGVRRPYVLLTGTLEPRKNVPRVIEAFVGLEEAVRAGWTLVLAGAPGWETQATFAAVAKQRDLVRTLGYVSDEELACLYRDAEVFCYLSLYEGFGMPVLEAMQSGTAVLTSSVSSMPEVGGEAVRYADPLDIAAIRNGLRELLVAPELRRRCASAGILRAKAFDWTVTARTVIRVLEALPARSR